MIPLNSQTNWLAAKWTAVLQREKDLNIKYLDIDLFLGRHCIERLLYRERHCIARSLCRGRHFIAK